MLARIAPARNLAPMWTPVRMMVVFVLSARTRHRPPHWLPEVVERLATAGAEATETKAELAERISPSLQRPTRHKSAPADEPEAPAPAEKGPMWRRPWFARQTTAPE